MDGLFLKDWIHFNGLLDEKKSSERDKRGKKDDEEITRSKVESVVKK